MMIELGNLTFSEFYNVTSLEDLFAEKEEMQANGFYNLKIDNEYVLGKLLYVNFEGFIFCYQLWDLHKPFNLAVLSGKSIVKIQFEIEGGEFTFDNQTNLTFEMIPLNYQFIAKTKTDSVMQYKKSRKVVDIYMTESFLVKLLQSQGYYFTSLNTILEQSAYLFRIPVFITMRQYEMLDSLIHHDYSNTFAMDFIECRSRELIISVFNGACNRCHKYKYSKEDEFTIDHIKTYIDTYYNKEFSLHALSKQFFINQCKLKVLFKNRYKDTVFGYIRKKRLQCAYTLLINTDKCIKEIAYEVGFKYAHHFSRNFVKEYGILPKRIRQMVDK